MKKLLPIYLLLISLILTSCEIPIKVTKEDNTATKGEKVENNYFEVADYISSTILTKKVNIDGTDCIIATQRGENLVMSCNWK